LFNISVDQFFYPNTPPVKSTKRRQLDNVLDSLDDRDFLMAEIIVNGIKQAKEAE